MHGPRRDDPTTTTTHPSTADTPGPAAESGVPAALEGLTIVDFTRILSGPYATMLLADLGARVIKIERPGAGDDTRSWGPPWHAGTSTYYLSINRNKESIRLDLRNADDLAQARALVADADVVIENFRPGTMSRLGLDAESLRAHNPGLIYCSITGFGSTGGADLAGYDLIVQAAGGLMSITGTDESGPLKSGVAVVDIITGLHATVGILAALRYRERSGRGQTIEVNLLSSLLSALTNQVTSQLLTGRDSGALGNAHPSIAPYELIPARDRPLALAAANDKLFRSLCEAIGHPELADLPDYATNRARVAHRAALKETLAEIFTQRDADSWFTLLRKAGVPCAPINNLGQALDLAESLGLDPITRPAQPCRAPEGVEQIKNPITMSLTPPQHRLDPPD